MTDHLYLSWLYRTLFRNTSKLILSDRNYCCFTLVAVIFLPFIHLSLVKLSLLILAVVAVTALAYLVDQLYAPRHSPTEPPLLPARIPYLGRIIGLLQHGIAYLEMTRYPTPSPLAESPNQGTNADQPLSAPGANFPSTHFICFLEMFM